MKLFVILWIVFKFEWVEECLISLTAGILKNMNQNMSEKLCDDYFLLWLMPPNLCNLAQMYWHIPFCIKRAIQFYLQNYAKFYYWWPLLSASLLFLVFTNLGPSIVFIFCYPRLFLSIINGFFPFYWQKWHLKDRTVVACY